MVKVIESVPSLCVCLLVNAGTTIGGLHPSCEKDFRAKAHLDGFLTNFWGPMFCVVDYGRERCFNAWAVSYDNYSAFYVDSHVKLTVHLQCSVNKSEISGWCSHVTVRIYILKH